MLVARHEIIDSEERNLTLGITLVDGSSNHIGMEYGDVLIDMAVTSQPLR